MNKFKIIIPIYVLFLVVTASCSDDDETSINNVDPPTAVTLVFPENNTVCNEGVTFSDTETDVLFEWEQAINASSYVLQIINLNDGTSRNISSTSMEYTIRILRGASYSWSVTSFVSGSNDSAKSAIWQFYNAGLPGENHPPFPAEGISPQAGSTVDEGSIALQWEASDIDNDIISYSIFLDTINPPQVEVGNTSNTSLGVAVSSGLIYYWKIVTTDEVGNASDSQVFQFRVN
jgi:hypothetical protein